MKFNHEKALAGEPIRCGKANLTPNMRWNPNKQRWELEGTVFWDINGQPVEGNPNPPLTTTPMGLLENICQKVKESRL